MSRKTQRYEEVGVTGGNAALLSPDRQVRWAGWGQSHQAGLAGKTGLGEKLLNTRKIKV